MLLFKRKKVEVTNVFNYTIFKHNVPSHLYNKKSLREDVNKIFESEIIKEQGSQSLERTGKAYSTCGLGEEHIINLTDVKPLLNYITKCILENFYDEKDSQSKILYARMWSNKMYKDCEGACHIHEGDNDGTAIFYLNVPKNGSKLVILKYNIKRTLKESDKNISHLIDVKTGDLVFYDEKVPHSVSKHMSDEPRICFVFDFKKV